MPITAAAVPVPALVEAELIPLMLLLLILTAPFELIIPTEVPVAPEPVAEKVESVLPLIVTVPVPELLMPAL